MKRLIAVVITAAALTGCTPCIQIGTAIHTTGPGVKTYRCTEPDGSTFTTNDPGNLNRAKCKLVK